MNNKSCSKTRKSVEKEDIVNPVSIFFVRTYRTASVDMVNDLLNLLSHGSICTGVTKDILQTAKIFKDSTFLI